MISRLARASMRSSSSGVTAWKWLKSKRSRSGATREPACFTCGPSTSRSAADEGQDLGVRRLVLMTAGELGLAEIGDELAVQLDGRRLLTPIGLDRLAGARPLLLHAGAEAVVVDAAAALLGDLPGEVDR